MTPNELIGQWLREQDSERTRRQYAHIFTLFIPWFERTTGRPFTLQDWTTFDTRAFRDSLLHPEPPNRPLKAATVNNRLAALASFCSWAIERGHLTTNPVAGVKRIKASRRPPHVLNRNESNALQRALETLNPQQRYIVQFLLNTGLRVSEFCALTLQDVWLGERRETLDQLLDHLPQKAMIGEVWVSDGKGHVQREVHLNPDARRALLDYLVVRPNINDPHILLSLKYHRAIGPHSVNKFLEKLARDTGIHGLHPHLFRAEAATRLGRAGVPVQVIATTLGHSNIATTQKYLGVIPGEQRAALDKISMSED